MRLTEEEVESIKRAYRETFVKGKIYLFGSRVDDAERGGDIDLYVVPDEPDTKVKEKKIDFLVKLDEYLGEQKIDVVVAKERNRLIEREALEYGIEL